MLFLVIYRSRSLLGTNMLIFEDIGKTFEYKVYRLGKT